MSAEGKAPGRGAGGHWKGGTKYWKNNTLESHSQKQHFTFNKMLETAVRRNQKLVFFTKSQQNAVNARFYIGAKVKSSSASYYI